MNIAEGKKNIRLKDGFPIFLLISIIFIYILQAFSPLRLNYDGMDFISMGISAAEKGSPYADGFGKRYPIGYPYFLSTLINLNILNSATIILSNVVFLFLGGFLLSKIFEKYKLDNIDFKHIGIIVSLLSWILIKHFTIPLSDMLFFGISLACLFSLTQTQSKSGICAYFYFFLALLLFFLSILVRHVGISLLAPIIWCIFLKITHKNKHAIVLDRILCSAGIFIILFGAILISLGSIQMVLPDSIRQVYFFDRIPHIFGVRTVELGELFFNIHLSKFPLHSLITPLFAFAGISLFLLCLYRLFPKNGRTDIVSIYIVAYIGLICIAPWEDARYFMPIWPLVFLQVLVFWNGIYDHFPALAVFSARLWFIGYLLTGFFALAYSTWLTFSGPQFANRYGNAVTKMQYSAFYLDNYEGSIFDSDPNNLRIFNLLQRFDHTMKGCLKSQ